MKFYELVKTAEGRELLATILKVPEVLLEKIDRGIDIVVHQRIENEFVFVEA